MADYSIIGDSGLKRYGGTVDEEWLAKLKGTKAIKVYTEMADNDPTIGAFLFCIEMLCRQVKWEVEAGTDDKVGEEAKQFVEECMDDMSHTWEDLISEILSMLVFGWSYFEIVLKIRQGESPDPQRRSKYSDNRYGWRKIAIRSQESLYGWDFDDDGGIRAMNQYVIYGKEAGVKNIPIEKSLLFRTKSTKNNPEGRSILRNAFISYYFKKKIQELEAIGIERDFQGLPKMEMPLEYYNINASADMKATRTAIETMLRDLKNNERAFISMPSETDTEGKPSGFKLSLMSGGSQRAIDTDKVITRYKQEIAMSVLAQFIMLGMDKVGSFSLSKDQSSLFLTALSAWLNSIAAVFNRFAIPRLFAVNGIKLAKLPKIKPGSVQDISLTELSAFLKDTGLNMSLVDDLELENYLRGKANLPLKETETAL